MNMMKQRKIFFIIPGILIIFLIFIAILLCSGNNDVTSVPTHTISAPAIDTPAIIIGKPCRSVEEWHYAAEKKGSWAGGILVNPSMTDSEIFSLLIAYNLTNKERTRIYSPHAFGYYILMNESQNNSLLNTDLIFINKSPRISFSSPMYAFIEPVRTDVNGQRAVPVILSFGSDNEKAELIDDIARYNVSLHSTKIVYLGDVDVSGLEERESRLEELNRNPEVLFAFKEYLQEDVC